MKKLRLKMVALAAAVMMSLTAQAKTQDVGGRVIDQNGEPLGFVSVALLSADSTYIHGTGESQLFTPVGYQAGADLSPLERAVGGRNGTLVCDSQQQFLYH